jgi:hypothetical protein
VGSAVVCPKKESKKQEVVECTRNFKEWQGVILSLVPEEKRKVFIILLVYRQGL